MTSYRLFPATNGPAATAGSSASFVSGVAFAVKGGGNWFEGYWWWVCPTGQAVTPRKFALWSATSSGAGVVVPGSVVTSGALTAGQWNYVPLPAPVELAASLDPGNSTTGSAYIACVGVNGAFPLTASQFNLGDPYAAGITSGPLTAYSGTTGSRPAPYGLHQGLFSAAGTDPSVTMANQGDSSGDGASNLWIDVQVSDTAPAGYSGSYRALPAKYDSSPDATGDAALPYNLAFQGNLSQLSTLNNMWFYSPSGSLPTSCSVWRISDQAQVAGIASPAWLKPDGTAASAGAGWVKAAFAPGTTLPAGQYRWAVGNAGGAGGSWSLKDAFSGYFTAGVGSAGITSGPLTMVRWADAAQADIYQGAGTTNGQPVFAVTATAYPNLTTGNNPAQMYFVDAEVTPAVSGTAALTVPKPSVAATGTASPPAPYAVISRPCYCSRDDVKGALDLEITAVDDRRVDRAVQSVAEVIDGHLHRFFYPEDKACYLDWPNFQYAYPWRFWLDQPGAHDLWVLTRLQSPAGTDIPLWQVFLEPANRKRGWPFTRMELDRSTTAAWGGASTPQHSIVPTGTWGWYDPQAAGTLGAAVSAADWAVTVSDGSRAGAGDLLILEPGTAAAPYPQYPGTAGALGALTGERCIVTGKYAVTTGLTQSGAGCTTPSSSDVALSTTGSGSLSPGEALLLDSEQMLITDVTNGVATVKRAWNGTVLASHSAAAVYAYRQLSVLRGQLGTAAAPHAYGTAIAVHRPPGVIRDLAIAEALNRVLQETSGYARTAGSGEAAMPAPGVALADLWDEAETTYARKGRVRAI